MSTDAQKTALFVSTTYDDTVAMIDEVTDYLTNRAERDRKAIPETAAAAFAGESIRLTTRLMQVMAWLLNQRAVQAGELSVEEARQPSRRLGNVKVCLGAPYRGAQLLPMKLQDMLERSEDLFRRVLRLDKLLLMAPEDNPVHDLIRDLGSEITDKTGNTNS